MYKKYLIIILLVILNQNAFAYCMMPVLKSIENKLNSAKTIAIDFVEENNTKTKKIGHIYINKPGMMRIDYDLPEKISIIVNDQVVTYFDHQLNEVTKIKYHPKFLTFLSKNNINFKRDFEHFHCKSINNHTIIALKVKEDENTTEMIDLKLFFINDLLQKIEIISLDKRHSILQLQNIQYNIKINNNMFYLKDKNFYNIE